MTPTPELRNGEKITKVGVKDQHNPMAICTQCGRHALQTKMSRYCIAAIEGNNRCDECYST